MAVIYRITNMANQHYYIGSAESFERRKWQHLYDLKNNRHKNPRLQAAWNKYGADMFVFEVLETIADDRATFDVENTYLMRCVGQSDCYNINVDAYVPRLGIPHTEATKVKMSAKVQAALADGRGGKFIPTEETRAKMSESAKGNQNAKGYVRTAEEREAIRARMLGNQQWLGRTHSEESKELMARKIYGVNPEGKPEMFPSLTYLRDTYGTSLATIIRACKSGNTVQTGNLTGWRLSYEPLTPPEIPAQYADLPRTRQLAKQQGAKMYFTGEPCTRGHLSPRAVKGTCIECRREDERRARLAT